MSNFSTASDTLGVWAVCAPVTSLPYCRITSGSASDPAGVQKGIIVDCAPGVALGGNHSSNTANLPIAMKAGYPYPASGTDW